MPELEERETWDERQRRRDHHQEKKRRRAERERRKRERTPSPVGYDAELEKYQRFQGKRDERDERLKKRKVDEKENDQPSKQPEPKEAAKPPADPLSLRTGGAYIPPAKLKMMQQQISDKSSEQYQRLSWEALKKSINGLVNKINVANIKHMIKEVFRENLVRGRGLFARAVITAQAASPTFTHVYAALVAIVNTKFPQIGELILHRLILQFRRGFRRNAKDLCLSTTNFIAHLVNQQVAHELLALEILMLLLENPTDDSVEIAIGFLRQCGQKLTELTSKGTHAIFEQIRTTIHDVKLDVRTEYMFDVLVADRKAKFKDHPAVVEDLDLVEEGDQVTHTIGLDDAVTGQEQLNVFKFDENFLANEEKYDEIRKHFLGEDDEESSEDSGSGESGEEEEEEESEKKPMTIQDMTETNLVALRKVIYLTIQSSLDFEEAAHKLLKIDLPEGAEIELCNMVLDCCAQQRSFEKFYGLLAQRFCQLHRKYEEPFEQMFVEHFGIIHRYETYKLRNIAKFFAHLFASDAISWGAMECIKLNEEDTTSSSRVFIKYLFQELTEQLGLLNLNERLKDPTLESYFGGVFPKDTPRNTRFAINFFTSIGLGGLTDDLREHLKVLQLLQAQQQPKEEEPKEECSSNSSEEEAETDSASDSENTDSEDNPTDTKINIKKEIEELTSEQQRAKEKHIRELAERVREEERLNRSSSNRHRNDDDSRSGRRREDPHERRESRHHRPQSHHTRDSTDGFYNRERETRNNEDPTAANINIKREIEDLTLEERRSRERSPRDPDGRSRHYDQRRERSDRHEDHSRRHESRYERGRGEPEEYNRQPEDGRPARYSRRTEESRAERRGNGSEDYTRQQKNSRSVRYSGRSEESRPERRQDGSEDHNRQPRLSRPVRHNDRNEESRPERRRSDYREVADSDRPKSYRYENYPAEESNARKDNSLRNERSSHRRSPPKSSDNEDDGRRRSRKENSSREVREYRIERLNRPRDLSDKNVVSKKQRTQRVSSSDSSDDDSRRVSRNENTREKDSSSSSSDNEEGSEEDIEDQGRIENSRNQRTKTESSSSSDEEDSRQEILTRQRKKSHSSSSSSDQSNKLVHSRKENQRNERRRKVSPSDSSSSSDEEELSRQKKISKKVQPSSSDSDDSSDSQSNRKEKSRPVRKRHDSSEDGDRHRSNRRKESSNERHRRTSRLAGDQNSADKRGLAVRRHR